jgi:hypothetical protein
VSRGGVVAGPVEKTAASGGAPFLPDASSRARRLSFGGRFD